MQAWNNNRDHPRRSVSLSHSAGTAGVLPASTETAETERDHEENSAGARGEVFHCVIRVQYGF